MNQNQLNVEIKDTCLDPSLTPDRAKVHVREKDNKKYYKVWIYLEGNDLPYVDQVTYTLHETFRNPIRTVPRTASNPNCTLEIWTWGAFLVKATIQDKKGFTYIVDHQLTYDRLFPKERDRYAYEDEDPETSDRPTLVTYR